jgi:prevent-host-death family protein
MKRSSPGARAGSHRVGIRDLKNRLPEFVRQVRQGGEVIVTDRGRPVALLTAIESALPVASLDARLARLAAQGQIELPSGRRRGRITRVTVRGNLTSRQVLDDRR